MRLSYSVWVEAPREERLRRGLSRDGSAMLPTWQRWMEREAAHFSGDATLSRADLIVDGAPLQTHDPEHEFVALGSRRQP